MELTAATLSVRMSKMIVQELDYSVSTVFFWTDSMSVIRYIAKEKTRFHTFVANRIEVIREASNLKQWKYIETSMNPADIASRGTRIHKFLQASFWLQGPDFLWSHEEEWKKEAYLNYHLPESDPEVKKVVNSVSMQQTDLMDRLMLHYSDWWKQKKAVGWMLRVFDTLKAKTLKKEIPKPKTQLTSDILERAEAAIIKQVQRKHFPEELKSAYQQKNIVSTRLRKLDPVMIEGILRVGGRLSRADIPVESFYPRNLMSLDSS